MLKRALLFILVVASSLVATAGSAPASASDNCVEVPGSGDWGIVVFFVHVCPEAPNPGATPGVSEAWASGEMTCRTFFAGPANPGRTNVCIGTRAPLPPLPPLPPILPHEVCGPPIGGDFLGGAVYAYTDFCVGNPNPSGPWYISDPWKSGDWDCRTVIPSPVSSGRITVCLGDRL